MLNKDPISLENIISEYQNDLINEEINTRKNLKSKLFFFFSLSFISMFFYLNVFHSTPLNQKLIDQQNSSFYSEKNKLNRIGKPVLNFNFLINENPESVSSYNYTFTFIKESEMNIKDSILSAYHVPEFYSIHKNSNNYNVHTIQLDIPVPDDIEFSKTDSDTLLKFLLEYKPFFGKDKNDNTGLLKTLIIQYISSKYFKSFNKQ